MTKVLISTVAAAMLLSAAGITRAETLANLIANNGSITQGDKLFNNFSYLGSGDMPDASGINVIGVTVDGNYGIRFQGAFSDSSSSVGPSDALITYSVTVLDPNMRITDAHLIANVAGIGNPFTGSGSVTETFLPNVPQFLTTFNIDNTQFKLTDSYVWGLPGYTHLDVQKDILLNATSGVVTLSFVDQTFSQSPVPLPAAAWAGFALFGGLGLRRRGRGEIASA